MGKKHSPFKIKDSKKVFLKTASLSVKEKRGEEQIQLTKAIVAFLKDYGKGKLGDC
jgi:hypothetical protein